MFWNCILWRLISWQKPPHRFSKKNFKEKINQIEYLFYNDEVKKDRKFVDGRILSPIFFQKFLQGLIFIFLLKFSKNSENETHLSWNLRGYQENPGIWDKRCLICKDLWKHERLWLVEVFVSAAWALPKRGETANLEYTSHHWVCSAKYLRLRQLKVNER